MKIALVTGVSRGLGKSMALHIADNGNDVILTYRSRKDEADAVVSSIEKKWAVRLLPSSSTHLTPVRLTTLQNL